MLLLQHGRVVASVSQQLKEQCSKSPLLWKELQQELREELKTAKQEAKDARKGEAHWRSWGVDCGSRLQQLRNRVQGAQAGNGLVCPAASTFTQSQSPTHQHPHTPRLCLSLFC